MRKKILLGVLALSTIITAAGIEDVMNEVNNKYGYASGNLKISAEVVAPITLEVEELDFGTVPMGKIKDIPMKEGKIKIEGAAGKNVQLFFYPTGSGSAIANGGMLTKNVPIELINTTNKDSKIIYLPRILDEHVDLNTNTVALVDGSKTLIVTGSVDAAGAQDLGKYETNMTVRVKYQ